MNVRFNHRLLILPAGIICLAFFLLPLTRLVWLSASGGGAGYLAIITDPVYYRSLLSTVVLSVTVTVISLVIATVTGLFLTDSRLEGQSSQGKSSQGQLSQGKPSQGKAFRGKTLLIAMLSFPLAFPGVVIGFFIIMLGGRQGLVAQLSLALSGERWVFAYSIAGLFLGYLYFSIPRVVLTVMGAAEKLDPGLPEAGRSLGASRWQILRDITLPALMPGLISSGSVCFATSMGAFGTAFTLATQIDVLPMTIYTEFTLNANFAMAATLSLVLGGITWLCLVMARMKGAGSVNMGG
ncbi:Sulfate transport system permease protein CysW [Vibrio aerogenes CECT 7868]|uniref:Sulfate transport system permease protein CysW n=1 Tax=Vibrio aerogenes CECT 7868 TaxID=1216006 RepID=A0A1M5ZN90_9VIBR|nr:ABC transporter permease [Vibrio aerogenes]SHI25651.1 Sulfate transport system permease protein CysW [Vibrio aerogenes CECT 7868]